MANEGIVSVHIGGRYGNEELTPDNFDISYLHELLGYMQTLLQEGRKIESPTVLKVESGSVKAVFKTSKEKAMKFSALILMLSSSSSLDQFEPKTSRAFEGLQSFALKNNFDLDVSTSESSHTASITPFTNYRRTLETWVDSEIYLYGKIVDAGGKNKGNIHLDTEHGTFVIEADKTFLESIKTNILYKKQGVKIMAKQNVVTGDIDNSTARLIEFIDYRPVFDAEYLKRKREMASPSWKGIDAERYIEQIREGSYVG